jgi:Tol biopolymer transport system component
LILLEHFGANAPDGSGLASGPNGRSLWLISADGTGLRELTPGQPGDGKTNAVWSRDGMHIAFETVDPRRVVYETDVAGRALQKVGHELCSGFVEGSNPCAEGGPAYSPDGNDLATVLLVRDGSFSTPVRDGTTQHVIYIRHRYESNESCSRSDTCFHLGFPLDATQVATSTAWIEGLSWSPDGTKIAYYRVAKDADGKPLGSELWIVNADGTDAHPIPLPAGLSAGDPDWSPDGSLIVFSSQPIHDWDEVGVSGTPDVYTVRPDGTDLKRLTHDHGSGAPSWTSDGKILFYSQRALWLMDADGSNATPVFPNGPTLWGEATGWSYYGYSQPMP